MIYDILKDEVGLKKLDQDWLLVYYNTREEEILIARFTDGPLQNMLMIQAARQVVKCKLLDFFVVDADEDSVARLRRNVPDMIESAKL
jgi:hypothetical protein